MRQDTRDLFWRVQNLKEPGEDNHLASGHRKGVGHFIFEDFETILETLILRRMNLECVKDGHTKCTNLFIFHRFAKVAQGVLCRIP